MNRWKLLLVALALVASWQPSNAAPVVYEISTVLTTFYHIIPAPCGANDPYNAEFCDHWDSQIGDTAQFRILIDTERQGADPLGYFFNDFYVELIGVNFDGLWLDTSIIGGGRLETFGNQCTHSVWGCGGIHVGYWTFFSQAPSVEEWLDPSFQRYFCNALGRPGSSWHYCDFGGTGTMTDIRRVPEPGSLMLVGLGIAGIALGRGRTK